MPILINEEKSDIVAGGEGSDGDLVLRGADGTERIRLDSRLANAWIGGNGTDGDLVLFPSTGDNANADQASIWLDGAGANVYVGGNGEEGDLVLFPPSGNNATLDQATIRFDGGLADGWIGGNGQDGGLALFPSSGNNRTLSQATIHLNGGSGDIILANADCAEDFEVEDPTGTEPGTVMVISDESCLRVSEHAYDRRVAGVIAGAGDHRPGIVLGRGRGGAGRMPVALIGRVLCKVDAYESAIDVGDLLTTSHMKGHAMRATDSGRAVGAVIGKALAPFKSGQGLIPVLVSLQ